jgi:hypothetical protein
MAVRSFGTARMRFPVWGEFRSAYRLTVECDEKGRERYKRVTAGETPSPDNERVFTITLRAENGVNAHRALRGLLRSTLRFYGLRCLTIRPGGAA